MLREKFTENLNYSQFFSFEVLDYFDSIATNENYEWIEKYFDILMRKENKIAKKFNDHHIRLAFTFRDDNHKNRKETKLLANKVKGNKCRKNENERNARMCIDPINGTTCTYGTLRSRKKRNKEKYKDIVPRDCIIEENQ